MNRCMVNTCRAAGRNKKRMAQKDFTLFFPWGEGYSSGEMEIPAKQSPAKPFLKWVGGKTQLLPELEARLPRDFTTSVKVYAEAFLGGGALLFRLLSRGMRPERVIVNDSNPDLANVWRTVQVRSDELLEKLARYQKEYAGIDGEEQKRGYFMGIRRDFNEDALKGPAPDVLRAAQLLFLNKTCFNGLYRVNAAGKFNVPFGRYVHPRICDEENIRAASEALAGIEILSGDFSEAVAGAGPGWFSYFDPPYRPISATSAFCDYTCGGFGDAEQRRLAELCRHLDAAGARWMLSNSDSPDGFFDELYHGFRIDRVRAGRAINSKGDGRGKVSELIVTNARSA